MLLLFMLLRTLVGFATFVDAYVDTIVLDVAASSVFTDAAKPNVTDD